MEWPAPNALLRCVSDVAHMSDDRQAHLKWWAWASAQVLRMLSLKSMPRHVCVCVDTAQSRKLLHPWVPGSAARVFF